ncbi:MAG: anthranilate phosphoribosyltransferase [Sulfuricurvum sp. PC08-66]|nr:MAG: anthranilate phosphoribosyltransferase [Sulfuricurvum sp. PC08-66]
MTFEESINTFEHLFRHEMSDEAMHALLVHLYEHGETASDIAGAAMVMREHAIKLPVPEGMEYELIDNCGTGGDKSGSFNISTTVSILLSAAGCKVAKHGNRSITSRSGSADVLEALGVNLNLSPADQVVMLQECGFVFIFAVNHHPAMKFIMPIRKAIPHRTIFNILGPLTNPAGVKKQFMGVFDKSFIEPVISALKLNMTKRAMVVSSDNGMDEIGISGVTHAATLFDDVIEHFVINPEDFGFALADVEAIKGGDATLNAAILRGVLDGSIAGAKRDIVLLNAGASLWVDGRASSMPEGIAVAQSLIDSGAAIAQLDKIIATSRRFA